MTPVVGILSWVVQIFTWILLARALVSWIPNLDPSNPAIQLLYSITEPILAPIRKLVPPIGGVMDISIIIVFIALMLIGQLLRSIA